MNTFRKLLVKVVALPLFFVISSSGYAAVINGCNLIISQTDLAPDRESKVYVTLSQPGAESCEASFMTPNDTTWTTATKCHALVNAVNQCATKGYLVTNDACDTGVPFPKFTLAGTANVLDVGVGLAISNKGFGNNNNQDNTESPLPNYEREILTPTLNPASCTPPGFASQATLAGSVASALLVMKGTATGVSFISGQPAAITVVVKGITTTTATVNTAAGMTTSEIVSGKPGVVGLNQQLAQAGVTCSVVTSPATGILCAQPSVGFAKGFGISTSDTGIGVGNASGPTNSIMNAFNGPVIDNDIPLPLPALVVLASLLAGSGIFVGRRKRK